MLITDSSTSIKGPPADEQEQPVLTLAELQPWGPLGPQGYSTFFDRIDISALVKPRLSSIVHSSSLSESLIR